MNNFFLYFNTYKDSEKYDNIRMVSGDREAIWALWYTLRHINNYPNVTVRDMKGEIVNCANGVTKMNIYDPSCFMGESNATEGKLYANN